MGRLKKKKGNKDRGSREGGKEEEGKDTEKKKEQCQNCAPGSNLQRQARPPPFTLNHDCDLFFSTLSSIHHRSGPPVTALPLSSPLHKVKPCHKARTSAEYNRVVVI